MRTAGKRPRNEGFDWDESRAALGREDRTHEEAERLGNFSGCFQIKEKFRESSHAISRSFHWRRKNGSGGIKNGVVGKTIGTGGMRGDGRESGTNGKTMEGK